MKVRGQPTDKYKDFGTTAPSHITPFTVVLIFIMMTKEEKRLYDIEYRKKNKEKLAANKRAWYEKHKEEKAAYDKIYRAEHVEKRQNYKKEWNKRKKEHTSDYNKSYYETLLGLARRRRNHYVYEDKKAGHDTAQTVTYKWIIENILTDKSCIYCGDSEKEHLGCDRIDNSKGHTPDNIVCACPICNWERSLENMTVQEFIEYRKTHPRLKETMNDGLDRKTGEKKPLKKKKLPYHD